MSISPLGNNFAWSTRAATSSLTASPTVDVVLGPLRSQDSKYLTEDDRASLRAATGVDFRASGAAMYPVDMEFNDARAVASAAGQVAYERATGKLNGPLTSDYLASLLNDYKYSGIGSTTSPVDFWS